VAAPEQPQGGKKVKPGTAVVVVAVVAFAGILWLRYRKSAASGTTGGTAGTATSTVTYGLGPQWVATWQEDHDGPPHKRHRRGFTDWQGHR